MANYNDLQRQLKNEMIATDKWFIDLDCGRINRLTNELNELINN